MAPNPPWSDLPPELLAAISKFLEQNPIDVLSFRAVCKSWFSCLSLLPRNLLSPSLPVTVPFPDLSRYSSFLSSNLKYVLSVTVVYALHPPNGVQIEDGSSTTTPKTWIVFVDELNPGKLTFREPFTRSTFYTPVVFPWKLNLLDFRASEIGRFYNVTDIRVDHGKLIKPRFWSADADKVVITSNGSAVVVLFKGGKLGMLRLGVGNTVLDTEWQIIHNGSKKLILDDIIEYKGRMLGIDRKGKVYEISYYSSEMKVIAWIRGEDERRKRLIESLGNLYLVTRCTHYGRTKETGMFKVYVFNEKNGSWIATAGIGDRIFLFGDGFSISTSAKEIEGSYRKNCIIFYGLSFKKYNQKYGDFGQFDGSRSNTCVGVYNLEDGDRFHAIESYPGYTNLVWPPPTWLWRNNKLKLLEIFGTTTERLLYRIQNADLKDKFIGLFPLVVAIVSGEGISQQDIPDILKEADMLNRFLGELVVQLEIECKSVKKDIAQESLSRRRQTESSNLLHQEGTSTLGVGFKNGCVDTVKKKGTRTRRPTKSENDWKKSEMTRRLVTHHELLVLFRGVISVIGEKNIKDDMEASNKLQSLLMER